MALKKITGGCLCGALAYEAEVDENSMGLCHCRDCQILGGSAFRIAAMVAPDKFHLTKGTPKYFEKTAESGNVRRLMFCETCGTHLTGQPLDGQPGFISLRLASADQFADFAPKFEVFCASQVPWWQQVDGTAAFDKMPG